VLSADRRVVVCLLVMTGKAHASHRQMSKSARAPAAKLGLNCSPTDHSFTPPAATTTTPATAPHTRFTHISSFTHAT
jgi:hypothetical protein